MGLRSKPTSPEAFITGVDSSHNAELHQQIQKLQQELALFTAREQELVADIERMQSSGEVERQQLQGEIVKLRDHLQQSQGIVRFPIEKIRPNPKQPRQTFGEEVEAMMLSLQAEGQLDPIILFEDGTIFDGECRWRSGRALGWTQLDAVFITRPQDEKTLLRQAYLSGRHRRNLNALDQAEALVAITCNEIADLSPQEVPRIISRVLKRIQRESQRSGEIKLESNLHLQPPEKQRIAIEQIKEKVDIDAIETKVWILFLGLQEHPASLERNIFPTLRLPVDLKDAIRHQRLGCSQALALNSLSAVELEITEKKALELRASGIEAVTTQNLSEAETKKWVKKQKQRFIGDKLVSRARNKQGDRAIASLRSLDLQMPFSPEQRQELKYLLQSTLKQLEELELENANC